jgi:hypothetical protein
MFAVTLSAASSTQVSVSYATANSTAIAGNDYTVTNVVLEVLHTRFSHSLLSWKPAGTQFTRARHPSLKYPV